MASAIKTGWQFNPLFAGSGAFALHGLTATGTDNDSWTVNQDAAALVDEDSSVVIQGGDGSNLIAHHIEQDSGLGLLSIYKTVDGSEAGTTISIGDRGQIADIEQTLEFAGGNAASPHIAKFSWSSTLGELVLQQELPVATPAATTLKLGGTAGGGLRMTELASDLAEVANSGSLYVKDDSGDTELFFRSAGGVIQVTENGALKVTSFAVTLDNAYDDGRTITVDAGPIVLDHSTTSGILDIQPGLAAETAAAIAIGFTAVAYTGTPHGVEIDYSGVTSLTNASHIYGLRLVGDTNAGAGSSVGVSVASGWDLGVWLGDDQTIVLGDSADASLAWNTTQLNDAVVLGLGADNLFVICEQADVGYDFAHGTPSNPTLFIHNTNQSTTGWVSLAHDTTAGILSTGGGDIILHPFSGTLEVEGELLKIDGTGDATIDIDASTGNDAIIEFSESTTKRAQIYYDATGNNLIIDTDEAGSGVTVTPVGALTLTPTTSSTWSLSGSDAGTLTLTIDAINAGGGTGILELAADDQIIFDVGGAVMSVYANYVQLADNDEMRWGDGGDCGIQWSAGDSNPPMKIGVGQTSKSLIICDMNDIGTDFGRGDQTDPTLFIQSADHLTPAEWLGFYHDGTDGIVETGTGGIVLKPAAGAVDIIAASGSSPGLVLFEQTNQRANIIYSYTNNRIELVALEDPSNVYLNGLNGYVILDSVKTTTGDPTGSDGMIVINEFDNTVKIYADGGWRTLASGW